MKMKSFSLLLVFIALLLVSCKKEKDDIGEITAAKIQGKWQIDSVNINQEFNGNISKVSYKGTESDYIEFGSDGNMRTFFQNKNHVSTYKVRDGAIITIGGDSGNIQELTENKFILHTRAEAGSLGYLETTYYLKR